MEIELRGPLTRARFQALLRFLKKEATFVKKTRRKTFVFHTNDKTLDLKIRTTDGQSEIVVKKGFWGARKREEVALPIKTVHVETAKELIAALGYNRGIIPIRETHVFKYKKVELSLVKCPKNYFFYEAEFIGGLSISHPEAYVKKILNSLKLKIWTEKEVYDFLMFCKNKIDKPFEIS